jgi:hypothetical protein
MNVAVRIGARSWMNQAAGSPVPNITKPMTLNVQAVPSRRTMADMAKLMTAPPKPPPA